MPEPLLTNDRARREWAYIVERVGLEAANRALEAISGGQRPYPLNVARKLGLSLPEDLAAPPPASREVALSHISALRDKLNLPRRR